MSSSVAAWAGAMQAEDPFAPPENGGEAKAVPQLSWRFYTVADLANMTRLSADTVQREIKSGSLNAHKIRGRWRIEDRDIRVWISRSRHTPARGLPVTAITTATTIKLQDYEW